MNIEDAAPQFRNECMSPEGQELWGLIKRHSDEMVRVSGTGRPALEAVIPHVTLRLASELATRDRLMQAFGHMARLEMLGKELTEKGVVKSYEWPTIRITSDLTTFHGAGTDAVSS